MAFGAIGVMMEARGLDHEVRKMITFEVKRAQFGMVDSQDFRFDLRQVLCCLRGPSVYFCKMLRERPGHCDFADVMDQARDVVGFIRRRLDEADDLPGDDGGADAMLPKIAPGK